MYTVGLDVDTHSIMKIAGVIALSASICICISGPTFAKKYKNYSSTKFSGSLSENSGAVRGTNYFSGRLAPNHYISEIKDFSILA